MRILIAVYATSSNNNGRNQHNNSSYSNRIDAVLKTWAQDVKDPHRLVIAGDVGLYKKYPDKEVWVTASGAFDTYSRLPHKTLSTFRIALTHKDWDFIVKVDDDTFVHFDRLKNFLETIDPFSDFYCGHPILHGLVYACGGAGYIMSRHCLLHIWNKLEDITLSDTSTQEDKTVGLAATETNIYLYQLPDYFTQHGHHRNSDENAITSIMGDAITTHPVTPHTFKTLYNLIKLRKL